MAKSNDELVREICGMVADGELPESACRRVGLRRNLLIRWIEGNGRIAKSRAISEEDAAEVFDLISDEHLSLADACGLAGVAESTMREWACGSNPKNREWGIAYRRACADRARYWHKRVREAESNPEVRKAMKMLQAFDPNFRKAEKESDGVTVNILTGSPEGTGEIVSVEQTVSGALEGGKG
jgi:hypothetical protein